MQTTEILLIRHGETDWNKDKRLQGHLDIALNAEGQRQAQALSACLAELTLDAVFSSDLQRARDTAQPLAAQHGLTLDVHADLRERCYGVMEGLRRPEIAERYPEAFNALNTRELDVRYPPGVNVAETLNEFSERAMGAMQRILGNTSHRRIAIVSHGGFLDCIYRHIENRTMREMRKFDILNASINRLVWTGAQLKLVDWGDVSHLRYLNNIALDEIDR
ncbi:histidine phosphatase family protein [Glaciimonas sp. CA11.2]|uniref:histidine phosphatase family protein n=1 Tax=Glaciimonas sp. CA11.2 TaxID=3048601 RepID=UPI002AB38C1C|nr:histidine phosphatase family protein [Glaciimonas sp. CA11.2]MDY7546480.1 histidine phosphatase family protein [Glaciimonas sp. CA11.2]MEB0161744.1 histidine phosphatase family protein [Glaciimonas sp. CA11.2]